MIDLSRLRHIGGFILAGSLAFFTDVGVFQFLHGVLSVNLLIARVLSIATAMLVSWLINRRLTFAMPGPPRLAEFLRFVAIAWISSSVNYVLFAGLMLWRPQTVPLLAIVFATAVSMLVSYAGMRLGVFRKG